MPNLDTPLPVMGVLLAAGGGSRFRAAGGTHKLLAMIDGVPLWRRSLDHLLAAGLAHNVVITGAASIDGAIASLNSDNVHSVHNLAWADGQATSLQLAVDAARDIGVEAIVVGLADQPFISPAAWRAVADAPRSCSLVVATYDGEWGPNPVRIGSVHWDELPTTGDAGARSVLHRLRDDVC